MDQQTALGGLAPPAPVGPFVREQIIRRLHEASRIAERDLSAQLDLFHKLIVEILERVEAIDLAVPRENALKDPDGEPPPPPGVTSAFTRRATPASEFLLIPFGEISVDRPLAGEDFVFTQQHALAAKRWFDKMGRQLAIDYEHQTFDRFNGRTDGLRPAAGWIGGLEVRDDGLWAVNVRWTERAENLLRQTEYLYFSPVIFWADEDHTELASLGPVALTNDPAMHGVKPLAAARGSGDVENDASTGASGGDGPELPEGRGGDAILGALRNEVTRAREEAATLRRQLAGRDADAFVERGLRLGKVLDSTSFDWRDDYLRDPEAAEQKLSRAPVLLPQGRVLPLDRRGAVCDERNVTMSQSGNGFTLHQTLIEPEDLSAFAQAVAAGRVSRAGTLVGTSGASRH